MSLASSSRSFSDVLPWWQRNFRRLLSSFLLFTTLVIFLIREVSIKFTKFRRVIKRPGEVAAKVQRTGEFLSSMWAYNRFAVEQCRQALFCLSEQKITEISVYGANEIAAILYSVSYGFPVRVTAIYDECPRWMFGILPVLPLKDFRNSHGPMLVAAVVGVEEKVKRLSQLGVNVENLVLMGRPHNGLSRLTQELQFLTDDIHLQ